MLIYQMKDHTVLNWIAVYNYQSLNQNKLLIINHRNTGNNFQRKFIEIHETRRHGLYHIALPL